MATEKLADAPRRRRFAMSSYDLILRGGTIVRAGGAEEADLAAGDGRIAAVGPELEVTAGEEIDARSLQVLPCAIDAHFNEPGR